MGTMAPEVAEAIEGVRTAYAGHDVEVVPEAQGGAYVAVGNLPLGDRYAPCQSWVGFLIPFQYPSADVYPHFIDGTVTPTDGAPLGDGFSGPTEWQGRRAWQVSRRSNRWNPATDTAALKLAKVMEWLRSR